MTTINQAKQRVAKRSHPGHPCQDEYLTARKGAYNLRAISADVELCAKVFKCAPDQYRALLRKNAAAIRSYTERDLKRAGWTREQANQIADEYDKKAI